MEKGENHDKNCGLLPLLAPDAPFLDRGQTQIKPKMPIGAQKLNTIAVLAFSIISRCPVLQ